MYKNKLSAASLKWIAIVTMLVDHIGATVISHLLDIGIENPSNLVISYDSLVSLYYAMRCIGRIAFPLFAFMIAEGMIHSHDTNKYISRLLIFAVISEIPFDMAFRKSFVCFDYNNVFFTLAIGAIVIFIIQHLKVKTIWSRDIKIVFLLFFGMIDAVFLRTDYDALGVLLIVLFYLMHEKRGCYFIPLLVFNLLNICAGNGIEVVSMFAYLILYNYNGEKGGQNKYFFYIFYPAHLLVLSIITYFT